MFFSFTFFYVNIQRSINTVEHLNISIGTVICCCSIYEDLIQFVNIIMHVATCYYSHIHLLNLFGIGLFSHYPLGFLLRRFCFIYCVQALQAFLQSLALFFAAGQTSHDDVPNWIRSSQLEQQLGSGCPNGTIIQD